MEFTEKTGRLIVTVDDDERKQLEEMRHEAAHSSAGALALPFESDEMMIDFFEDFTCNSEWEWIAPEDNGDLTDAPILGVHGEPERRYAFMDYALRTPLQDLLNTGVCIFIGPN